MPTRGRPRSFDRDAALEAALQIFWAKGYEGTQLTDLTRAMGINPPSFYAAFTSKSATFREVLDRYLHTAGAAPLAALDAHANLADALKAMLLASMETALSNPLGEGCMISLGLLNHQPQNEVLRAEMRDLRGATAVAIRARLQRGVDRGDMDPDIDLTRLSMFFATIMQGLSLQARDGAGREALAGLIETAMLVLPAARQDREYVSPESTER